MLITGGAGFIGSHTADALIRAGYQVRALDNLDPQVHGPIGNTPSYLHPDVEFIHGDIRDQDTLSRALIDIRIVYHFAAQTGVTQSMYDIRNYVDINVTGTAALWDVIINQKLDVEKVILASSRAVYGEGAYFCHGCESEVYPVPRSEGQLKRGEWKVCCPRCGEQIESIATREDKPLQPLSLYAQSKRFQEEICESVGKTYGIPVVSLRYFNVYGPRQALSNPYTGVVPVFCSRILAHRPIAIYEDGRPIRDFIHVKDVVQANLLALDFKNNDFTILNIGSGNKLTILDIAHAICDLMEVEPNLEFTNQYRLGDIRSCFADIGKAHQIFGFEPTIYFEDGISNLIRWVMRQDDIVDSYEDSVSRLENKGLLNHSLS